MPRLPPETKTTDTGQLAKEATVVGIFPLLLYTLLGGGFDGISGDQDRLAATVYEVTSDTVRDVAAWCEYSDILRWLFIVSVIVEFA